MLSLNIFVRNKDNLNKTSSTIENSPNSPSQEESKKEEDLKKVRSSIDDQVNKIMSGHYENQNNEENEEGGEMGMGGMMRGGPGPQGYQNQVRPYQNKMEAFKARLKIFGLFVFHITGLYFLRRFSYNIAK